MTRIFPPHLATLRSVAPSCLSLGASALLVLGSGSALGQIIIDDHFDGPDVVGWMSQGNTRGITDHNITQANSVISSEVVASQSNTNRGIVSETSFEPNATGGFTMTFVADSVDTVPAANGYFIGLVRDNDVFHRDSSTRNFGLVFFGIDNRTSSAGGFGLVYGDNNGSSSADFHLGNSDDQGDVTRDSFLDGFIATVTVDPEGWSYEITGLLDSAGSETTFTGTGTWAEAGTDFDTLWPEGDSWYAMGALQVGPATTHTIAFDQITVVGGAGAGGLGFQYTITHDTAAGTLLFRWDSQDGKLYNLRSETDPSAEAPGDWPVFGGQEDLEATPPENSLTIPLPAESQRFFVVEEFNAPPVELFSDDFENGQGDWTTGSDGDDGTAWEFGTPSIVGPPSANSPPNCFATNLSAEYGTSANVWLRSPPIDLSSVSQATLRFSQFKDIEEGFDFGSVSVLDAADDSVLAVLESPVDGVDVSWNQLSRSLPGEAFGKTIKIEFRFTSDDLQGFAGWYIDDVSLVGN